MSRIAGTLTRLIVIGCAVLLLAACTRNPFAPAASNSTNAPATVPPTVEVPGSTIETAASSGQAPSPTGNGGGQGLAPSKP